MRSLNEEETEKLSIEEIIAYWNIIHKIDPRLVRHAFEEAFIDRGSASPPLRRGLSRGATSHAPRSMKCTMIQ